MLADKDRILTKPYGFQPWGRDALVLGETPTPGSAIGRTASCPDCVPTSLLEAAG